jgi:hypothetical protein
MYRARSMYNDEKSMNSMRGSQSTRPLALSWASVSRLVRALSYVGTYSAWILTFRLLVLTFLTYFLMASGRHPRFEDISEAFGANELTVMGLGALLFVFFLRALHPVSTTTTAEIFTPARFEKFFLPGFAHGATLAAGVTLAFVLSGHYRYLGSFIQFEEAPLAGLTVLVRIFALGVFAYCEEFIFRHKISRHLLHQFGRAKAGRLSVRLITASVVAILYCGIKLLQFDLGVSQLATLFLVSLALSMRTFADGDFGRGAGFWAAMLIVFQPLLSLPAFGGDFAGLILIKYQAPASAATGDDAARILTGGVGGPLSSLALQMLLALDVARHLFKGRKSRNRLPRSAPAASANEPSNQA